ncbi:MAG: hypothetical protein JNL57_02965 [Bacteroidetes bacterium]|nr:hypothetical protein [Bacteroidota bacterium]
MVRYCHFTPQTTGTFYDLVAVNSGLNDGKGKEIALKTSGGNEWGYGFSALITGGQGKAMMAEGTVAAPYIGGYVSRSAWNLATTGYLIREPSGGAAYNQDLSGKCRFANIRATVGFMLMMKKGLFLDMNFQAGVRMKNLAFNEKRTGSSEPYGFSNTVFDSPYLQEKDWTAGKLYPSIRGDFRFGLAF